MKRRPLRAVALPWLLAPLAAVAYLLTAFATVWSEPAFDRLPAAERAAAVERLCPVDALLVMGAAQYDGTPSGAFERRLALAASLSASGCAVRIVVSGGGRDGDRTTEGEAGVAWLAPRVPGTVALLAESSARTTVENLRFGAALLPPGRLLIVTDDLHAPRTRLAAERLGLEAEVIGARVTVGRIRYAVREVIGALSYRFGAFD